MSSNVVKYVEWFSFISVLAQIDKLQLTSSSALRGIQHEHECGHPKGL